LAVHCCESIDPKEKARSDKNEPFCIFVGSPGQTRTADRVVNSHLLYLLSYRGMNRDYIPLDCGFLAKRSHMVKIKHQPFNLFFLIFWKNLIPNQQTDSKYAGR
jgi:hypothetical protein